MDQQARLEDGPQAIGAERARWLQALVDLCADRPQAEPDRMPLADGPRLAAPLGLEDDRLLSSLRTGLKQLAGSGPEPLEDSESALRAALDGAELVARGEILSGERRRLSDLLPSFAFLVVLPRSGTAEALRVATRASHLVDAAASAS
jgi:hypothetical protein